MSRTNIVLQVCQLLKVLFATECSLEPLLVDDNWRKSVDKILIFAFFWSVSTIMPHNNFGRFERYLWDIFSLEPVKGTLSNFFYTLNKTGSEFCKWDTIIEPFKYY